MTYIILERIYIDGEHVDNKEVYRGAARPTRTLKRDQAIFTIGQKTKLNPALAYPSAFGL